MADNDKTIGGRRGRGNDNNGDMHATGRASRPGRGTDEHATARGARAQRPAADEHSTAKGVRGQSANPRPFQQQIKLAGHLSADASADGAAEWPDFFELDGVKYKN